MFIPLFIALKRDQKVSCRTSALVKDLVCKKGYSLLLRITLLFGSIICCPSSKCLGFFFKLYSLTFDLHVHFHPSSVFLPLDSNVNSITYVVWHVKIITFPLSASLAQSKPRWWIVIHSCVGYTVTRWSKRGGSGPLDVFSIILESVMLQCQLK